MNRLLLCLVSALLLTSCASILNDKTYVVKIQSDEANARVRVQDSIYTLPVTTEIKRSKEDLVFTLLKEHKNTEFRVKSKLSGKLLLNAPLFVFVFPGIVAAIIDGNSNKIYHYGGKSFFLSAKDSTVTASTPILISYGDYVPMKYRRKKGDSYLHLSLPFVNSFRNTPLGEGKHTSTGMRGISAGFDYYHRMDQFLNLSASYVTDYAFLITEPNDIYEFGHPERNYSTYLSLSNNHKIKSFSIGYGLSFSNKVWKPGTGSEASNTSSTQNHNALGLIFPGYFQLGKTFNIGVIYRPTFYRFTPTEQFQYEHLISLDLAWKIKL